VRLGTAGRVALAVGTDGDGFRFQRYREGLSDALAEAFKLTGVEKGMTFRTIDPSHIHTPVLR
jgi:hypothetical protein